MAGRSIRAACAVAASGALVLALAGCTTQSSEPAAEETAAPAEETAAPAEETAAPAEGEKWCSGVKIAAFPGGPQGGVFANNVYNGFVQAQKDLGADVTYYFSDWDAAKLVSQGKEALATNPDGIATYGFGGEEAMGQLADEAFSKGIIFTVLNTELPDTQKKYQGQGSGFVGAINYNAGFDLGTKTVEVAGLKEGDQALVWGLVSLPSRGERTQGVIDAFEKAGVKVVYQEIDQATNADPQAGTPTFVGLIGANPDVKAVVTDHGGLTATLETYLTAAGKGPDDIFGAGFDVSPATVQAIESGFTDLVIDQQPFLQGYLPILNICLTKKFGFSGLFVNTGAGFVTKENVAAVAPLAEVEIR
ncbi:MAG: substrate-binding domain-containing protein [Actinomycetales bacterium]|nr:substrate-binding domain-containing protein [Actinomycetales bacterium]